VWTSSPHSFTFLPRQLPHRLPHIRTFLNFGSRPELIASRYDLTYVGDAKQYNPRIITVHYSLACTCVVASPRAEMLEQWCVRRGLTKQGILEDLFLHFSRDTKVTLHVGAERANKPVETRVVPGWDPRNDRNGDGIVDDEEAAHLVNAQATARKKSQARVPIYYWPPPRGDYVMNLGHPEYRRFMAEEYLPSRLKGYDAIYTDTTTPHIPGPRRAAVLEYPGPQANEAWLQDLQRMMAAFKKHNPQALWLANGWSARPFVIDGMLRENWLNIGRSEGYLLSAVRSVRELDRRGKIQLVQYNPVYDPKDSEFGVKVAVSKDRDRMYGLAAYYLAAGDYTYFAIGGHPYVRAEDKWFAAIETDVGQPEGEPFVFYEREPSEKAGPNLLPVGDFERDEDHDGKPDGWQIAEPVKLVTDTRHSGRSAARIESDTQAINNINRYFVTLKPHTTYTLVAWIKTEAVSGSPGAQVYAWGFEGAAGTELITVKGTTPWQRYTVAFTTADDVSGRINFRLYGASGKAWFDDLALYEGLHLPWRVWARRFSKALVLVRPAVTGYGDDTAQDFALDGPYRRLHMDGTLDQPATSVRLRSGEGAVLLRAEGKAR
ncbi:MAG: carbohydrate binding domain-containing protein, partial [Armatimonadetes bacterium]|nr:carbohydrate binding domain-containing protein [Armatimonadota bacterium]